LNPFLELPSTHAIAVLSLSATKLEASTEEARTIGVKRLTEDCCLFCGQQNMVPFTSKAMGLTHKLSKSIIMSRGARLEASGREIGSTSADTFTDVHTDIESVPTHGQPA
jgi:hypothetical protein